MVTPTEALRKAAERLETLRREGLWRGFPTLAGQSEVWVSGFVVAHLRESESIAFDPTPTVAALLDVRHADGGWGYGGDVPTDADSTAWCTVALDRAGAGDALSGARNVLASHRRGNGFATYVPDSGIIEYIGASSSSAVVGWTAAHPDVTAAVLLAGVPPDESRDGETILRNVVTSQTGAGFVPSYWWRGPYYGSALILRALNGRRRRLDPAQEGLMYRGLVRMQLADGGFGLGSASQADPFSTALALEAMCRLSHLDEDGRRHRSAHALMKAQREDGGWEGDFVMRIPAPTVTDPRNVDRWSRSTGGGNSFVRDVDGVFATTVSAYALNLWQREPEDTRDWEPVVPAPADRDDEVAALSTSG